MSKFVKPRKEYKLKWSAANNVQMVWILEGVVSLAFLVIWNSMLLLEIGFEVKSESWRDGLCLIKFYFLGGFMTNTTPKERWIPEVNMSRIKPDFFTLQPNCPLAELLTIVLLWTPPMFKIVFLFFFLYAFITSPCSCHMQYCFCYSKWELAHLSVCKALTCFYTLIGINTFLFFDTSNFFFIST